MEDIRIGEMPGSEMPPEPPQQRAEEIGQDQKIKKRTSKKEGFSVKQPVKKQAKKEEEEVKTASPEEAKAEAMRPKLDRPQVVREGKIRRKIPKGSARPL